MKAIIQYLLSLKDEYKLCEFFAILFLIDIEAKKVLGKTIVSNKWKFEYCGLYNYDIYNLLGDNNVFKVLENNEELVFSWPLTRTHVCLVNRKDYDPNSLGKDELKVIKKVLKKIEGKDMHSVFKTILSTEPFQNIKKGEMLRI